MTTSTSPVCAAPWWRFPIVWLVLGGPLAVVVAGIVTAWLAIDGADVSVPPVAAAQEHGAAPALAARNHAATPVAAGSASR